MRINIEKKFLKLIFPAALLMALSPGSLRAQAGPAATKKAEISAFAMYSRVSPDYGTKNNGITFGGDYTRRMHWFLVPSLEVRATFAPGNTVGERTFGGGLRVEHPIWRLHPYADFLVSAGTITFTHPSIDSRGRLYKSDNSLVYTYGGGLEYDVTSRWAAKIDYQGEHWNLGSAAQTLTPRVFSVGLVYRIPFRSFHKH
ncbi:MAG: outer membrane beta-barrel protein [Edaphobacter sp.]